MESHNSSPKISKNIDGKIYSTNNARLIASEKNQRIFWKDAFHTKYIRTFLYRQNEKEYFVIRQLIEKTRKGKSTEINYLEPVSISSARSIYSSCDFRIQYEDAFEYKVRRFTISTIMETLQLNEIDTRKLLIDVGVQISDLVQDPNETISSWEVGSLMSKFWDSSKGNYTQEGYAVGELLKED